MPINTYTIKLADSLVTGGLSDKCLELDVLYTPDEDKEVTMIVVNGTAREKLPYQYLKDVNPNKLHIVNITSVVVTVIFVNSTETFVSDFSVANPKLYTYTRNTIANLLQKYDSLHNYYDNNAGDDITSDEFYNSPFDTTKPGLTEKSIVDLVLQPAYDGSVNMIWTSDSGPMRIVNSRFSTDETGNTAYLIDRRARKDTNTYSDQNFHQTELIPKAVNIPTLTFNGLVDGGILKGGGYKYFFRYVTADGAETDIIEESRLVSVHEGTTTTTAYGLSGKQTTRAASFTLTNLDQSFYGIVVYYTIAVGDVEAIDVAYKIAEPFLIDNTGSCNIMHTGFESSVGIDIASLSLTYSTISRSKTLTVVNNRLLVGNTEARDIYDEKLARAASAVMIGEGSFIVKQHTDLDKSTSSENEENYSNPNFIYNNLGYWKGETYELGIVFITESGLSPVYPLQGIDKLASTTEDVVYDQDLLGGLYTDFARFGQNSKGVYRTKNTTNWWTYNEGASRLEFNGTNLTVDITELEGRLADSDIKGFFFVRRNRKKDCILQGLLTSATAVPIETKFGQDNEPYGYGNYSGVGLTSSIFGGNVKMVPCPGCIMPWGAEEVKADSDSYQKLTVGDAFTDVTVVATVTNANKFKLTSTRGLSAGDRLKLQKTDGTVIAGPVEIGAINTDTNEITIADSGVITASADFLVYWAENVKSGQSTDFYTQAPIKEFNTLASYAMYSPDIDCAPSYFASILAGGTVGTKIYRQPITFEKVTTASTEKASLNRETLLYHKIISDPGSISAFAASPVTTVQYVGTGSVGASPKSFSGVMDRNLYLFWSKEIGESGLDNARIFSLSSTGDTFYKTIEGKKPLSKRPGSAVAYSSYLGLKIPALTTELSDLNIAQTDADNNTKAYNSLVGYLASTNTNPDNATFSQPQIGYIAKIYMSQTAAPIVASAWKARYAQDEDSEYSAISRRYTWDECFGDIPTTGKIITLYGGDCFIGMSWKQVYMPLGIQEAPQSNDITAYETTRRSLGLLPYGYAIPVPAQSNYNFNIRSKERVSDQEYKVYGTDRSFLPVRGITSIRGNRQYETGLYNHGYSATAQSAFKQFRLNANAPYYQFKYPNRVYASSVSNESEFVNGFSNFKGLNYKDYNSDLGAITKLICLNNVLVAVFANGISQIGVDERSMVSKDTGGVYVDSGVVLSRSNVRNSCYGSTYLGSICASNNYVYGVDFVKVKIWRTNGDQVELISDMKVQNKLESIKADLLTRLAGTTGWIDISTNFDQRKNEMYFTFILNVPDGNPYYGYSRTIVFNEVLNMWVCETNDTRKFVFQSNEGRYAIPALRTLSNNIYRYDITNMPTTDVGIEVFGDYNKFYGTIYDMYYDYAMLDEASLYKILSNTFIIGNNSLPTKLTYRSDFNINDAGIDQVLKPYTNVSYRMYEANGTTPVNVTGTVGERTLTLSTTPAEIYKLQRPLKYGDMISVVDPIDAHIVYIFTVIAYDSITLTITVDKPIEVTLTNQPLHYGCTYPMRLSDSAFEEGFGVITNQFNNVDQSYGGHSATKIRGKWFRIRNTYKGTAPVYIAGVLTDYLISLS